MFSRNVQAPNKRDCSRLSLSWFWLLLLAVVVMVMVVSPFYPPRDANDCVTLLTMPYTAREKNSSNELCATHKLMNHFAKNKNSRWSTPCIWLITSINNTCTNRFGIVYIRIDLLVHQNVSSCFCCCWLQNTLFKLGKQIVTCALSGSSFLTFDNMCICSIYFKRMEIPSFKHFNPHVSHGMLSFFLNRFVVISQCTVNSLFDARKWHTNKKTLRIVDFFLSPGFFGRVEVLAKKSALSATKHNSIFAIFFASIRSKLIRQKSAQFVI